MTADLILFLLSGVVALGWSLFNGAHRRNPVYKSKIRESAGKFPVFARRRLLRLVAPTRFEDRVNHALVIAGCCCIILSPVLVLSWFYTALDWWHSPLIIGAGTVIGSFLGEFAVNSIGCSIELQGQSIEPQLEHEPVSENQARNA